MATTTNFSVRMDSDIKKQCEALYGELGINLTTAINVFLRQSLRAGGFSFWGNNGNLCARTFCQRTQKALAFCSDFCFLTKALLSWLSPLSSLSTLSTLSTLSILSMRFYPSLSSDGTFLRKSHSPMVYVG